MMITIDCTGVENARQMHELLARELSFPPYYGHNLDALFDCLTEMGNRTIRLEGYMALGEWKDRFTGVFANVALENPDLDIVLI